MSDQLLAYHGDEDIKAAYLQRVIAHRAADELVQGVAWERGKGCAVGCTLEAYDHARYPIELGVPIILARLEDAIFEGLPPADAQAWPERFLSAIPVGANLADVWPQFAVWLLVDETHGVIRHAKSEQTRKAISDVANLYRERAPANDPRWRAAADAADATARAAYAAYAANAAYAAYAANAANAAYAAYAAYAYAAYAAYAANAAYAAYAANAAYAYAYAAANAADAAANAYARKKHWRACADKLESLLAAQEPK